MRHKYHLRVCGVFHEIAYEKRFQVVVESTGKLIDQKHTAIFYHTQKRGEDPEEILISKRFFRKRDRNIDPISFKENHFIRFFFSRHDPNISAFAAVRILDALLEVIGIKELVDRITSELLQIRGQGNIGTAIGDDLFLKHVNIDRVL